MKNLLSNRIHILGIPIDNVTIDDTIQKIMDLIVAYPKNRLPQLISTVNTDFLINVHGWSISNPSNPELLQVLRNSALVTADGMPIKWLSQILGTPLKERIAGSDLVPKLTEAMARRNMALFLLGGAKDTAKKTANILKEKYPGIKISGVASPQIYIQGDKLINNDDASIIEQINEAKPDVLFIGLGNPKQEIWFERVRSRLDVPIAIGIGGTFSLINGDLMRAPFWMQNMGLEWLFRLYQEPKRLFKRYTKDLFNGLFLTVPLIFYLFISKVIMKISSLTADKASKNGDSFLFQSPSRNIYVITLPQNIDQIALQDLGTHFNEAFKHREFILDFKQVKHIEQAGLDFLLTIWEKARQNKTEIYGLGMSAHIKFLMILQRVWDLFYKNMHADLATIIDRIDDNGILFLTSVSEQPNEIKISIFGNLDNQKIPKEEEITFSQKIPQKDVILNLSYCTFIDNSGFVHILKLKELINKNGHTLKIINIPEQIKREFKNTLPSVFINKGAL